VLGLSRSLIPAGLEKWWEIEWTTLRGLDQRAGRLRVGVALLLLAVLIHSGTVFLERRTEQPQMSVATHVRLISPAVAFDPGQALLRYSADGRNVDLTIAACSVKKALMATSASEALVIGRHDQTQLGKVARETFSSNEGIAQQRAEEVRRYLTEDNSCGIGIRSAIALIAGPRAIGKRAHQRAALDEDRVVEVWGIGP
jgi:hypothetical protein